MSPKDLTLLRRGYVLGYRAALRKCRADLHVLAADFDAWLMRRIFPPRGPESPPSREAASSANSARGGVGAVGVRAIEALKHQPHSNPQARQARQSETKRDTPTP